MEQNSWMHWVQLLDEQQQIPKQSKSHGAIEFWRNWDPERMCAVWGKTYRSNGGFNLNAFNDAEIEWLLALARNRVLGTYKSARIERVGTKLSAPSHTVIETLDAGPTLDDWLSATVRMSGSAKPQAHILVQPEAFLRLTLGILKVLEGVHECHFVHCDIHPGNITLPAHCQTDGQERIHVAVRWDDLSLIDFGYAINSRKPPLTTLPMLVKGEGVRVSPLLQRILEEVEQAGCRLLKPHEHWENVWLDPAWWQRLPQSPLNAFAELDWREDLYQLGKMLADIRDGVGVAAHLKGRTLRTSPVRHVNEWVATLPEQLMAWATTTHADAPPQRPHRQLIDKLQAALHDARTAGQECPAQFQMYAADFDAATVSVPAHVPVNPPSSPRSVARETVLSRPRATVPSPVNPAIIQLFADMVPLRVAAPSGWQLVVGRVPVTWQQWEQVAQHNPKLARQSVLRSAAAQKGGEGDHAVCGASHRDCMKFIDTLNQLCGTHDMDPLAHFRMPTLADWSLLAQTDEVAPAKTLAQAATVVVTPVISWPANAHGIAGLHGHLWQWLAASEGVDWAPVRGGCFAEQATTSGPDRNAADQYPVDWRSPYITLRLVRHVPVAP